MKKEGKEAEEWKEGEKERECGSKEGRKGGRGME